MAAAASAFLASQLPAPKSSPSSLSGLRHACLHTDQAFFRKIDSHLTLSAPRTPSRPVLAMAASGKFFVGGNWKCNGTKDSIGKLVSDLNSAKLEDDVDHTKSFSRNNSDGAPGKEEELE